MRYKIKELFYTLQGEGAQSGRPAVFCRFTGCNLWSGREEDRSEAVCRFCDTDFRGTDGENGGRYSAQSLAEKARSLWPENAGGKPYIVCTGGEPLLQLDEALTETLHRAGFEVAVETNGTMVPPPGIDWVCVSPKDMNQMIQKTGDELKLVYPQDKVQPQDVDTLNFFFFFLQPKDEAGIDHTKEVVDYCLQHPKWKLSLQTHKIIGIS